MGQFLNNWSFVGYILLACGFIILLAGIADSVLATLALIRPGVIISPEYSLTVAMLVFTPFGIVSVFFFVTPDVELHLHYRSVTDKSKLFRIRKVIITILIITLVIAGFIIGYSYWRAQQLPAGTP